MQPQTTFSRGRSLEFPLLCSAISLESITPPDGSPKGAVRGTSQILLHRPSRLARCGLLQKKTFYLVTIISCHTQIIYKKNISYQSERMASKKLYYIYQDWTLWIVCIKLGSLLLSFWQRRVTTLLRTTNSSQEILPSHVHHARLSALAQLRAVDTKLQTKTCSLQLKGRPKQHSGSESWQQTIWFLYYIIDSCIFCYYITIYRLYIIIRYINLCSILHVSFGSTWRMGLSNKLVLAQCHFAPCSWQSAQSS